jgi:beta-glucosidase
VDDGSDVGGGAGGGAAAGALGGGSSGGGGAAARPSLPFYDPALTLEARVDDLMGRLTLREKSGLMEMNSPAIERLGIAAYHWWNEALHGVARSGTATVFPQAIGMAASWDPDLHLQMAKAIADEGRAKHNSALQRGVHSIYTGLDFWSPNVNIFRDPRWGRGQETYGEDPYLTGRMGVAFVKGLQGEDPNFFETIATPKHFAVHSGPEMERHRADTQVSAVDLFTTYLPAFEATVREGKAYSVMAAYNRFNGVPASANPWLLTDLLRGVWGFQGYVVSDVDSVSDLYLSHRVAPTAEAAAAMAVKAGLDLNGGTTYGALPEAVRQGLITEAEVDKSLRRVLTARFRLGEFDPPGAAGSNTLRDRYASIPIEDNDSPAHDAVARQTARESMVLLKNAGVLPLKKDLRSIAVIGPNADSRTMQYGNYNGTAANAVTILQGIRNAVGAGTQVMYVPGCPLVTESLPLAEVVPASCVYTDATRRERGLYADYYRSVFNVERALRTRIDPRVDLNYPDQSDQDSFPYTDGFYTQWYGVLVPPVTGDYQLGMAGQDAYRLTLDGKLLVNQWNMLGPRSYGASVHLEKDKTYKILVEYAHPAAPPSTGTPAPATNTADVLAQLAARDAASVQLKWTRPVAGGGAGGADGLPLFADAMAAAKSADAVVVVLGITANLEREQQIVNFAGFSGGDRTTLDLPAVQERLLEAVTAAAGGKPVVVVLTNGSAMSVNWANEHVPAILEAWYPGQRGDAVADVLFGDYSPAGRLPVTFYKSVDDLPAFTDYAMAAGANSPGRTYRYFTGTPLYPFGWGLSYTKFEYSKLSVTAAPTTTQDVVVRVAVKNAGAAAGDEVVQVYVENPPPPAPAAAAQATMIVQPGPGAAGVAGSGGGANDAAAQAAAALPPKMLVGFKRVALKPGEEQTVEFTITPHQLGGAFSEKKHVNVARTITVQAAPNSGGGAGVSQKVAITGNAAEAEYRFVAPWVVTLPAAARP